MDGDPELPEYLGLLGLPRYLEPSESKAGPIGTITP